jgi:hypothetical protein
MNCCELMPFGRYRGQRLDAIPADYLHWLLSECDLKPHLRAAVERAYRQMCEADEPEQSSAIAIAPLVSRWHRQLAVEFHPDKRGGSHICMVAINRARDLLCEMAGVE